MPAKAGIHAAAETNEILGMDPSFRWGDEV
jgi:hypothetical protein